MAGGHGPQPDGAGARPAAPAAGPARFHRRSSNDGHGARSAISPARVDRSGCQELTAFATKQAAATGLATNTATFLAKGVLHAMTISKIKTLGVAILVAGSRWGSTDPGPPVRSAERGSPSGRSAGADDRAKRCFARSTGSMDFSTNWQSGTQTCSASFAYFARRSTISGPPGQKNRIRSPRKSGRSD